MSEDSNNTGDNLNIKNSLLNRINFGGKLYKFEDINDESYKEVENDNNTNDISIRDDNDLDLSSDKVNERIKRFGEIHDMNEDNNNVDDQNNSNNVHDNNNDVAVDKTNNDDDLFIDNLNPDSLVRPYTLFVIGNVINKLSTQQILSYAAQFASPPPFGLEWIDDKRCVLIWNESYDFRQGWRSLLDDNSSTHLPVNGQENYFDLSQAKKVPIEISKFSDEDDQNQSIKIRPATITDVKQKFSSKNSEWYSKYGSKAGKIGNHHNDSHKNRIHDKDEYRSRKSRLDDELDNIRGNRRELSPESKGTRNSRSNNNRRNDRRHKGVDELDKELEDYLLQRDK